MENKNGDKKFTDEVSKREKRKVRSRREGDKTVWFGLGMFGMVGWAVAIPTVVAAFIGVWIDLRWPSKYSWTLMLLFIGLILGCLNAWYWVQKERNAITRERENNHE
ncbi:MAG: AtpZ/AtpI family protein [Desulfobulbaceae bacterium]|nr:AtpZ/AtpI family protein [Desulfobulbaceae bacterium]MDY0350455.1 AtpZ/AtpI family protein [Desulfobulbaceae bacterium]